MRSVASSSSSSGISRSPQREGVRGEERESVGTDLVEGMSVEARFRGGSKYYPGRISRARLNGTFDIDYADGEKETSVQREYVRAKGRDRERDRDRDRDQAEPSPRSSRDRGAVSRRMEEGAKVEGNYKGKGKWYPGKITRDRRDGTFDIAYDDGESESRVDELLIRLSGVSSAQMSSSSGRDGGIEARAEDFREGSKVEADYRGKGKYYSGRITRARLNGTFDIDYDDGEKEVGVPRDSLRALSARDALDASGRRAAVFDGKFNKHRNSEVHRKGERVACYWYKNSSYGAAKRNDRARAGFILCHNADDTYTIEMESDGTIVDDVRDALISPWTDAVHNTSDSPSKESKSTVKGAVKVDIWAAVYEMGKEFRRQGKTKHHIPSPLDVDRQNFDQREKLERILGLSCVEELQSVFDKQDRHGDGEIEISKALIGFSSLGGDASEADLVKCLSDISPGRARNKALSFSNFALAYANIFHSSMPDTRGGGGDREGRAGVHTARTGAGGSLRLSGVMNFPGSFANMFGKKELEELENAFDLCAEQNSQGVSMIKPDRLKTAFLAMNKAVSTTRLQEWMDGAGVRLDDPLSLQDFMGAFSFFFSPALESNSGRTESRTRTLSEIAVQVMQEEKWEGTAEQTNAFMRRICVGRSEGVVLTVCGVRDAFDSLDTKDKGELSTSLLDSLLKQSGPSPPSSSLHRAAQAFKTKLVRQGRGTFSLPDFFEECGHAVQEQSGASVSVAEAFAMLRMHLSSTDVRACADFVIKIIDNLVEHPTDPKYWQVNVKNEVRDLW